MKKLIMAAVICGAIGLSACGKQTAADETVSVSSETIKSAETEQSQTASAPEKGECTTGEGGVLLLGGNEAGNEILQLETGYYEKVYWDQGTEFQAVTARFPYVHLSQEDQERYPELEQAITAYMDETKVLRMEYCQELKELYGTDFQVNPENAEPYEAVESVYVRRADSRAVSLLTEGYYDTGGAHGSYYWIGAVFDTRTGAKLSLEDVVTDVGILPDLIMEQIKDSGLEGELYSEEEARDFVNTYLEDIRWVLDYHGVTFCFNPYEIGPYSSGVIPVTLTFAKYPEIFQKEYQEVPNRYAIELVPFNDFLYDTDEDGRLDLLTVSAIKEYDSDVYQEQIIQFQGKTYEEALFYEQLEPIFVHTEAGRNYLYVGQRQTPAGNWVSQIFDLNEDSLKTVGNVPSARQTVSSDEEGCCGKRVFTDPENFIMETFTSVIGTAYAAETYRVGSDGMPEGKDGWLAVEDELVFHIQKDLTVSMVNEKGETVGTTELKKGTSVSYYRTDGDTWADLLLPDGTIGRAFLDKDDRRLLSDGSSVMEVFGGAEYWD